MAAHTSPVTSRPVRLGGSDAARRPRPVGAPEPSPWSRVASTVALLTVIISALLTAFAWPAVHSSVHNVPIAVSLCSRDHQPEHFTSAARAVMQLMERLLVDPLPADTILNVNVPDLPWEEIRGFEVTRLGHRHRAEPSVEQFDPRGRRVYWIGPAGPEQDAGPGTDFDAVRRGYVSVTPIHVDLTRYQAMEKVASWVGRMGHAEARVQA